MSTAKKTNTDVNDVGEFAKWVACEAVAFSSRNDCPDALSMTIWLDTFHIYARVVLVTPQHNVWWEKLDAKEGQGLAICLGNDHKLLDEYMKKTEGLEDDDVFYDLNEVHKHCDILMNISQKILEAARSGSSMCVKTINVCFDEDTTPKTTIRLPA